MPALVRSGCAVVLCALAGAAGAQRRGPDTSTRAVVEAAASYVADYQRQLTSILADETYTQDVVEQKPRQPNAPVSRSLRSEVFFMFASQVWMAIRDVIAVDGRPVVDRRDVKEALRTLPAHEVAAAFKEYNSRFNIGRTFRNFNEPTLSLLVLDEGHRGRFSFDRRTIEKSGDATLVTLAFTERESPTLIYDLRRGRVFSRGELVVEAGSGRVHRAVLRGRIQEVQVELTTVYEPEPRLNMWVPRVFREHYQFGAAPTSKSFDSLQEYEDIRCEARYSNYRRFETSVRIR